VRYLAAAGGAGRFRRATHAKVAESWSRGQARQLQPLPRMKPILFTGFQDGNITQSEPIIMTWNGVEMPQALRTLKPGQYVLLPFEPPDDILRPARKAA